MTAALFPLMAREFPDFDQSTLPVIPHHWQDLSWHNDISPSFSATPNANAGTGITVWIDYADAQVREFPETARFGAYLANEAGERTMTAEGDDWGAILRAVDSMQAEWEAILALNEASNGPTYVSLCDEFQTWARENNRPEGDAMENLHHPDNNPTQQRWLSDFIRRWDAMEETRHDLDDFVRSAGSSGITSARVDALRAAIARIQEGR